MFFKYSDSLKVGYFLNINYLLIFINNFYYEYYFYYDILLNVNVCILQFFKFINNVLS